MERFTNFIDFLSKPLSKKDFNINRRDPDFNKK